ncbi:hypothetical protein [Microbacterium sp. CFBP9034]|uniref:PilN domain-containing protein n=1 Tax=Microbacterium sp. CFBP9034 TaxID=3096540 RepID=UPI002A6AE4C8|nr:hypothetical protein [Microbacterium sp. CFBP9034]MDY0910038.1 hypothetical protein [Microbacterium sp. CFBP9034]
MTAIAPPLAGLARVNLMPRSEIVRRERDELVRRWIWIVFGAIIVAILIIGGAFWFKLMAEQRLAAEQAHTNALITEIASLSEVSQALATQSELTDYRTEAMAHDLEWAPVIAKVSGALPADAALTGFDFTVGGAPQTDDPSLEQGVVGTFAVDSPTPLDIVPIIRALRGIDGVLYADGQSITTSQASEGRFAYQLNVEFDQTVYSGAYASEDAAAEEGDN